MNQKRKTAIIFMCLFVLTVMPATGCQGTDVASTNGLDENTIDRNIQECEFEPDAMYELTSWQGLPFDVGDIVEFGNIYWRVLYKQDDKALFLSENTVASQSYAEWGAWPLTTWEESAVNLFLNEDFYNRFAGNERVRIADTLLETDDGYTASKLFLLSVDEVLLYLGDGSQISGVIPPPLFIDDEYNGERIAYDDFGTASTWWLRSLNERSTNAPFVMSDGIITTHGDFINGHSRGVRPAMWIYL